LDREEFPHGVEPNMTDREQRIGNNEILLREVNERIEELGAGATNLEWIGFVCECGAPSCVEQVQLEVQEYEAVRSNAQHFLTVPGHETPEIERVVLRHERYQIVEKDVGEPAELALETDPR
jgi:hypothetical protein